MYMFQPSVTETAKEHPQWFRHVREIDPVNDGPHFALGQQNSDYTSSAYIQRP
jgi:hypothetical protein